ncbi:hypothetical protein [Imbroritus primus]|uniref:hypothetical protein n=1 Tax=Imbroritus primus TaxID=3058603 RepID=UPI003D1623C2
MLHQASRIRALKSAPAQPAEQPDDEIDDLFDRSGWVPAEQPTKAVTDCSTDDCQCDARSIERGEWVPASDEGQPAEQPSASPVYDKSVVKRLATQMGWTPPGASPAELTDEQIVQTIREANGDWSHIQLITSTGEPTLVARKIVAGVLARAQGEQAAPMPVELLGIGEVMAGGGGFWHACSGCHESNNGVPTGPYSALLKCHLGNGCDECGGIGAIWDTTDYQAMADDMTRVEGTAAPGAEGEQA